MIVTAHNTAFLPISEGIVRNNSLYASRHRHDFLAHFDNRYSDRPIAWDKIKILQELVGAKDTKGGKSRWFLWIDADAAIVNHEIDYYDFVDDSKDMVVAIDSQGNKNTGVWLVKQSPRSMQILQDVWEQEDLIHDKWWENAAFIRVSQKYDTIGYLPWRPFNVYPEQYQKGDWCLHFAGGNKQQRMKFMKMKHPELRGML